MKPVDDYIPVELIKEATNFVNRITEDVEIYKKIMALDSVKQCIEAEKFVAWWDLQRYYEHEHSLFLLYEYQEYIEKLSSYMASSGKQYSNHAATIRSWALRDHPAPVKRTYECKEDESL